MIPFIGIDIIKNGTELETCVYRKPTNTGLLLHFQSHATNVSKPNAKARGRLTATISSSSAEISIIMISTFFEDVKPWGILMSLAPCQLKINYDIIPS
ncbi:unnamed protein product [Porites lobata]|uniref:Uncharacterized protein n=1 Tax=Porites lobata TaxID=104759 RepID=A0ABN8MNM8_9CNID|nr:unnamed protein product [Porites lobata]